MSDAASSPPVPVPAASLILLRQGEEGLEVLVGHRRPSARAFPGAIVFPGGKLEAQDAASAGAADFQHQARYGALRETFEETGLLIEAAGKGPPTGADIKLERRRVEAGEVTFADLLGRWERTAGLARLVPFAHWITPERAPYRFNTLFFLVAASSHEAQAALICAEFEQLRWTRPGTLLEQEMPRLITPTRHCLSVLAQSSTVSDALTAAAGRSLIYGEQVRAANRSR
ncbi:NUDIX domain-containing protein [Caulobacter sp. S45]|uniref:NUDIX domain-containing protein n=1 Tax=Caulobacter sp. S45 TaxID=1641861 RepID=UPI001577448A|nr:NUDIX domain-containing protein [Caulobacter sp. S45]